MQEFDKQFNKPVDNVILDRPTGTSEAPRKDTSDEEKSPRFTKKQKLIGGLTAAALAAGLAVGFGVAANGEKPAESPANTSEPFEPAPVDPIEEPGAGEEEPTTPEAPAAGEFLVPLEQLSEMSPEEITAISTISVESVTVNGEIDWSLYTEKLNQIYDLQINSGSTDNELESIYQDGLANGAEPTEYIKKYDQAFANGYMLNTETTDGIILYHESQINAAFIGYLRGSDAVRTDLDFTNFEIVSTGGDTHILNIEYRFTDNFFSSGAFDSEDSRATASLGRASDLDQVLSNSFVVKEATDGTLRIESVN